METPKEKLKKMIAWDTAPAIADADVDELLMQFSLTDAAGLAPAHEEWTPTYDLNAAAAQGWLIKAGKASDLVEVDRPDRACLRRRYSKTAARCRGSTR